MQTLINLVGPYRVLAAWIVGGVLKLFGLKGFFYIFAGNQARLIDDLTGTMPPYDKSIVLGPYKPDQFCIEASKKTGLIVSVVDVNDLGKVKVVATSHQNSVSFLKKSLKSNPAGNSDEKTPLLLLRPSKNTTDNL